MPLHDFAHDNTAVIVVDHDAGTLTVEADSVSYTFRRPGG
jgi:translation initiation factor RLI1